VNSKLKTLVAPKQSACGKNSKLVSQLLDWFAVNARDLPWRHTRDPYAIWVSEIMLQQTQVKTVIPFWNRWMRELPTIEAAAKASPAKIHKLWEGLGYYTRVRNLQKAAKQIVECRMRNAECGKMKFPKTFEEVLALPGIGRYTAGAICSIAFNQPTPILDGNVIRVLTRIFGIGGNPKERKTNARLWKLAEELVTRAAHLNSSRSSRRKEAHSKIRNSQNLLTSAATIKGSCSALNQSLMEVGALICTPRNPQCRICPVKKLCVAFRDNRVGELPNLGKRETATTRRFAAFVVERKGRFLVRQRPAGVVNAHLWEFPNVETTNGKSDLELAAKDIFGIAPVRIEPLCVVKHSITRYRITLDAFRVSSGGTSSTSPHSEKTKSGTRETRPSEKAGVWKTPAQMQSLAFTSAHRKVLGALTAGAAR
jgi:A/G-specific adenine glycosylase